MQVPSDFKFEAKHTAVMKDLDKIVSPLGTKDNPAISCKDLVNCQSKQFSAGKFKYLVTYS